MLVLLAGFAGMALWPHFGAGKRDLPKTQVLGSGYSLADAVSGTYSRADEKRGAGKTGRVQRVVYAPKRARASYPAKEKRTVAHIRGDYRSVCVRLCDGYYYAISHAVTSDLFWRDELLCQSSCMSPARLFVSKNSDDTMDAMVDLEGLPYSSLNTAFQYRVAYDPHCTCKSEPWSEEAKNTHRVYALEAAKEKGNQLVEFELADLKDKVAAQQRRVRERMGALAVSYLEPKPVSQVSKKAKARVKQAATQASKPVQSRRASVTRVVVKTRHAAPAVAQVRVPVARGLVRPVVVMRRGYVPATAHVRVTEARGLFR